HPGRETCHATPRMSVKLQEWLLRRKLQRSDLKEKLEISEKQLAKQRRLLEKQLKKQGMPVAESVGPMISPEELANRPKPKVVDTTALPSEHESRRKPSRAQMRAGETKGRSGPRGRHPT